MLIAKMAILNCFIYFGTTALSLGLLFVGTHILRSSPRIYWTGWGLVAPFGALWLISFVISYRVSMWIWK